MSYNTLFTKQVLILKFLMALTLLLNVNHINAGVNLKNGNFYISYTNVDLKNNTSSFEKITRNYNSKSTELGLFGFGWGSQLESKLKAYPDGHIIIQEFGAGGKSIFNPNIIEDIWLDEMINILIETDITEGKIKNKPSAIIKQREIYADFIKRSNAWDKYVDREILDYKKDFPEGMTWEGTNRGETKNIILIPNGYKRISSLKAFEEFNTNGQLTFIHKDKFKFSAIEYENEAIRKITNADKTIITFKTSESGFITEINFEGKKATYKYDKANLVFSEDMNGNQLAFEYDNIHNLTKIVYNPLATDGELEDAMKIKYHPANYFVAEIIDRDGEFKRYDYTIFYNDDGSKNNNKYGTKVTQLGFGGKENTNYYEWEIRTRANGSRYSYKISSIINGIKSETTLDEVCAEMPVEKKRGNLITTFEYNNRCLLTKKTSNSGEVVEMKYHPTSEKLIEVLTEGDLYKYEYNDNLSLIRAQINDDSPVTLTYDENGKIQEMNSADEVLSFEYNAIGKPIKILIEGQGHIEVVYDINGNIEKIDSDQGHEMALKITQAFQNLLNVVKPSGVSFGL